MTPPPRPVAAAVALALLIPACDDLREALGPFGPTSAPPPEVLAVMPLVEGLVADSADCIGAPGRPGYTCGVQGDGPAGLAAGAQAAAARMAGWEETSWDEVPGRIQQSWRQGDAQVSLAVHDLGSRTRWSVHYLIASADAAAGGRLAPEPAPDPDAVAPAALAALPLPPGARLLQADQKTDLICSATFAVSGDPAAIMALYEDMPGWTCQLRARTLWSRAVRWSRDQRELGMVLMLGEDGRHRLVLSCNRASG